MPDTIETSKRGKLSIPEAELLCSISSNEKKDESIINNALVEAEIRETSAKLAIYFETTRKTLKLKKYLSRATGAIPMEDPRFSLHSVLILFTAIRLAFLRTIRLIPIALPVYFGIAGFSYFIELFYDIFLMIQAACHPATSYEKQLTFWQRLRHAFFEDEERAVRMFNAIVWGLVNLSAFLITTVLAVSMAAALGPYFAPLVFITLNIIGYVVDIGVELNYIKGKGKYNSLLKTLKDSNASHQAEILKLENKVKDQTTPRHQIPELEKLIIEERKKSQADKIFIQQIEEKRKEFIRDRVRAILVATGILVGMLLIWFPPTSWAGITIVGASLAAAGSTFGGFGKKVYATMTSAFNTCKKLWEKRKYRSANNLEPFLTIPPHLLRSELKRNYSQPELATETPNVKASISTIKLPDPTYPHSPSFAAVPESPALITDEKGIFIENTSELNPLANTAEKNLAPVSETHDDIKFLEECLAEITLHPDSLTEQLVGIKDFDRLRSLLNLDKDHSALNEDQHLDRQMTEWIKNHAKDTTKDKAETMPLLPETTPLPKIRNNRYRIFNCSMKKTLSLRKLEIEREVGCDSKPGTGTIRQSVAC